MVTIKSKIIDLTGLHARPASMLTTTATKFQSEIKIVLGEKKGNLKSILNVMALGVKKDDVIEITIDGSDEEQAKKDLINLLESLKLGEIL